LNPNQIELEIRAAFRDWADLLVNPRFCRNSGLIAWTGYRGGGKLREPVTSAKLLTLVEEGQFSFQCSEDGSLFQILYQFGSDGKLEVVRLGFYQAIATQSKAQSEMIDSGYVPWLRIDYDEQAAAGVLHHGCHLHVHGFKNARIIVNGVPGPRQFVEFIIAAFYPTYYEIHRLDGRGGQADISILQAINTCSLPIAGEEGAPLLLHVGVPATAAGS
jgi:hypothetical protein